MPIILILIIRNIVVYIKKKSSVELQGVNLFKKILLLTIGYPFSVEKLSNIIEKKPWHYDIVEERNQDGKWIKPVHHFLDDPDKDKQRKLNTINEAINDNKEYIWVAPSNPFLVALELSFLTSVLFKNIIFTLELILSSL